MASDRNQQGGSKSDATGGTAGKAGGNREHTFGKGMTSPDSTEAVLDATTGEPDPRARGGQGGGGGKTSQSAKDQDIEQDV